MKFVERYESPLGAMTLISDGSALTGVLFDGQKYYPSCVKQLHVQERSRSQVNADSDPGAGSTAGPGTGTSAGSTEESGLRDTTGSTSAEPDSRARAQEILKQTKEWLDIYFGGSEPGFTPPLKVKESDFRQAVCEIMLQIPYGQTMTYGEIASIIAEQKGIPRMAAQAVGGAVGHNPISIIIPCHRVVGTNGSLTGYGGGIQRKVALLELEKVDMSQFFVPEKGTAL